jgi:hypothetical protein
MSDIFINYASDTVCGGLCRHLQGYAGGGGETGASHDNRIGKEKSCALIEHVLLAGRTFAAWPASPWPFG